MNKKILVVDDNKHNLLLFGDILIYYGYEVVIAGDGAEGIKMAKEHKPDLILMDLQMPVMNGLAAIKILKNDPETKDIKVAALTAFAMQEDRERVIDAGFDGYISKPIDTKKFSELVKELISKDE